MTKWEIVKDFLLKVLLPLGLVGVVLALGREVLFEGSPPNWIWALILCGIPFGVVRMRLWFIPKATSSFSFAVGLWALQIIIGGMIGGVVLVWHILCAPVYLGITIHRVTSYSKQNAVDISVDPNTDV